MIEAMGSPDAALEALAAGEVHVYAAPVAEPVEPGFARECVRDLAPDELERLRRYVRDRDRWPFAAGRCLVRRALSRYAPVPPRAWRFETEANGKPRIAGPAGAPALTFNVSNTRGLSACVVALERTVGIDVESVDRDPAVLDLADRCLAPDEARRVLSAAPSRRVRSFLEHWTLKEAYLKARGTGLSVAPALVSFDPDADPVRVRLDPRVGDAAARWWFVRCAPTQRHVLAAALERTRGGTETVRIIDAASLLR